MRSFDEILKEFENFFNLENDGKVKEGKLKARDANVDFDIDFMDAVKGVTKQVQFTRNEVCETCAGSKTKPGGEQLICGECEGAGNKM